ncbi:MAG: hypothetical protein K9G38_03425 [Bacteroidales bacterium]|nr:hypothetical protein [Bacteroidales bacterium]
MRFITIISFVWFASTIASGQWDECTIGVANGTATEDGRPMVWKTRDYESRPDNEVKYFTSYDINFISVVNAGSRSSSWMGVNEDGFAIVNSNSTDLPNGSDDGPGNGAFMLLALGQCSSVAEFETLLQETNITGRQTNANFGVIDASGVAAIFETAHTTYWKYDAADTPMGYVLRTNFAINGGGSNGTERLVRTVKIIGDLHAGDSLNHENILRYQMRDFSDIYSEPYPIPYLSAMGGMPAGYINSRVSICRNTSVSAAVIHGVRQGEHPGLSTMWTILGQPATSVALPYWPLVYTPNEADGLFTAPLCDVAREIKSVLFDVTDDSYINTSLLMDGNGGGLWPENFAYEDNLFLYAEGLLKEMRTEAAPVTSVLKSTEDSLALDAYDFLLGRLDYLNHAAIISKNYENSSTLYPNPFTEYTELKVKTGQPGYIEITVYSLTGSSYNTHKLLAEAPGEKNIRLDAAMFPTGSGTFLIRVVTPDYTNFFKAIRVTAH